MPRYIAFLRAINVGGHIVKMERLRALFEELGFAKVETFIASGNVVFASRSKRMSALEAQIGKHLQASLGYEVETFLRTDGEVARIAQHAAFPESELRAEGNTLYVAFLPTDPAPAAQAKLMEWQSETDLFHIHAREIYWLVRRARGESKLTGARLEKTIGMPATVRNFNTVVRLAAKYPAEGLRI